MSKVLVDRELLDSAATWLEVHAPGGGCVEGSVASDLRELLAQPAEADGVEVVGYRVVAGSEMLFDVYEEALRYTDEDEPEQLMTVAQHLAALSAVTAERDRLATENERLSREAKNDAIAYRAVIERQEELRSELKALKAQQGEPVAEIVNSEPYEDGSTNPHNTVNWFGRNAENDLPAGTKLYAAMAAKEA